MTIRSERCGGKLGEPNFRPAGQGPPGPYTWHTETMDCGTRNSGLHNCTRCPGCPDCQPEKSCAAALKATKEIWALWWKPMNDNKKREIFATIIGSAIAEATEALRKERDELRVACGFLADARIPVFVAGTALCPVCGKQSCQAGCQLRALREILNRSRK